MTLALTLANEKATAKFAKQLAQVITPPLIIYLIGQLGTGKTTLARYLIQALGFSAHVKSPTYTLVETYQINKLTVYHLDLYRLENAEELHDIGMRDYTDATSICLIEWPERGKGVLPAADVSCELRLQNSQRELSLIASTDRGKWVIAALG